MEKCGGGNMRKLIFTLSAINAVLNALVIGIFMPEQVIVLYGINGRAAAEGSRWTYLILVVIPILISGILVLVEKFSKKTALSSDEEGDEEEDILNPIDEMLSDHTQQSDNWGMVLTWSFAIISWVFTGIALNDIGDISIILPSIIVIMLSAVMIFLSSFYKDVAPNAVAGIPLRWLTKDKQLRDKTNRVASYLGVTGGFAGVCLAAWSLVISSNLPNCVAIVMLVVLAFIVPIFYSYAIYKEKNK